MNPDMGLRSHGPVPMFAGIDHVVLDQGMKAGQCKVVKVEGSDHAALLATVAVG